MVTVRPLKKPTRLLKMAPMLGTTRPTVVDAYRPQPELLSTPDPETRFGAQRVHAVRATANSLSCCAHPSKAARDTLLSAMVLDYPRQVMNRYDVGVSV
jgi:hypothetical protein